MWSYNYNNELYHHGVKGMKWGVRRTPEQLGRREKRLKNPIVSDMIKAGKISTKVNRESQGHHIQGSREYAKGKSRFFGSIGDAQKLIDELSGTGEPQMVNGKWNHKERVSASGIIGVYVNHETGKEQKTNKAMIAYSKTGSHIYPRKPTKGD
jgi:hypothetical protein